MTTRLARLGALIAEVVLLGLILVVSAFSGVSLSTPLTGLSWVIIGGGSMAPAAPLGTLVLSSRDTRDLAVGMIVTAAAPDGVEVTHRVTRLATLPSGAYVELRGDADAMPDPVLVPRAAIVGRAVLVLPGAGFGAALFRSPLGLAAIVLFGAAWYFAAGLLWVVAASQRRSRPEPAT